MLLHDWFEEMGIDAAEIEHCRRTGQFIKPQYVILTEGVSLRARYLYDVFASECQQGNGNCCDSISVLCEKTRMSRRSVIDARRELEHFGFIEVRRPAPLFGPNCHVEVSLRHPDEEQVEPWTSPRPDSPYEERRHGTRRGRKSKS